MSNSHTPRVRFAPSPTGYLHVGGARTALFNWLFARRAGGTFILRIEDTDAERNKPELVEGILDSLRWLGIDWDEGPVFQSQRLEIYREAAEKLLAAGHAFPCYCPPSSYAGADAAPADEAEEARDTKEKKTLRTQRCLCRSLSGAALDEAAEQAKARGIQPAIRFRAPEQGTTTFDDAVFGRREVQNEELEDFVILRSPKPGEQSRLPTYQLAAVVDDIAMRITHVIRGADHLSNTPKQVLLYHALGASTPVFAHVPLILGADRTRLSKRHGATSVGSYQDEGFLPEAFRNFLALLGWSPGTDEEFLRTPELVRRFSLEGVSRTNAVFGRDKLEWFNTQYLQKLPVEELLPFVAAELKRAGLWREEWAGSKKEWFARTVDLIRPRTRLLPDFAAWARGFFTDDFQYDPAAVEKFWKDPKLPALTEKLAAGYEALQDWSHDPCDKVLRDVAAAGNVKAGLLINATRVAILGSGHQAPTQIEGVARARSITNVAVFSPRDEHRMAFALKMSAHLPFPVEAVESAEEAVRDADVVVTVTSSKEPVLKGEWLTPGTHVNAVGANFPQKRELEDSVLSRVARIVVDSLEQSKDEAGDLVEPFRDSPGQWQRVHELSEVVSGKVPGRGNSGEITLFKSNGVALEDVAVAARVYERARQEKVGQKVRMWE